MNDLTNGHLVTKRRDSHLFASSCVLFSSILVLIQGGVVFGFSSLYEVLYREDVYASACNDRSSCSHSEGCCSEQRLRLTLMASCSLFAADGIMVLYGEMNDRFGPRSCLITGIVLGVLGFDLMAIGSSNTMWFAALVLLGISGPGVFMGCMGFGMYMSDLEPTITAACAAMWDSSSVIFLLFALATRHVSVAAAAGSWSVFCFCVGSVTITLLTAASRSNSAWQQHHDPSAPEEEQHKSVASILACLRRKDTLLLVLFMSLYNLNSAFYIESISDQIRASFAEPTAKRLDLTFDLAFPIGGLLTSVAAAKLLSRQDLSHAALFSLVYALAALFCTLQLAPLVSAQYMAALIFGPARTLQWSLYFHLLVVRYPESVSGRLIGYCNLAIALVGDGIPYALAAFVSMDNLPLTKAVKYTLVHVVLTVAILISGFFFLVHLSKAGAPSHDLTEPLLSGEDTTPATSAGDQYLRIDSTAAEISGFPEVLGSSRASSAAQ